MRFILAILLLLPLQSYAGAWTRVTPNHFNLLYAEGEQARFFLRVLHEPSNQDFSVKVLVEHVGQGAPVEVVLENGVGTFVSPVLAVGSQDFRVITYLLGPGDLPEDPSTIVEDEIWQLEVNPTE